MCLLDNNMDVGKRMRRIDDLDIFESPAKRSRPSPFVLSQAVPKRFLKAFTHVPDEKMGTVSFFGRIFPALVALLTGELCFSSIQSNNRHEGRNDKDYGRWKKQS